MAKTTDSNDGGTDAGGDAAVQSPVDVGFALTADVITGAGLSRSPRALAFFAESTCPSLDVARRADFVEYFLETTRASMHTIVHGVHLAFVDDLRMDVEALVAVLRERAVNILTVEPVEKTVDRTVECNLPEGASTWSPAVRRRARAAIATASAPDAGQAKPPVSAPPKPAAPGRGGIPRTRRSERAKPKANTGAIPTAGMTPTDADTAALHELLGERNRELAALQQELLDRNTALADAQVELAEARVEFSALSAEMERGADADELRATVSRLEAARKDTVRLQSALAQARHRAGLNALELSVAEQKLGWAQDYAAELTTLFEPAQNHVDEMAVELNRERAARIEAELHVDRVERDLQGMQGRAQRHRQEIAELLHTVKRAELASVDARAIFAGRIEAAEVLAEQSTQANYAELDALHVEMEQVLSANEGLRNELASERTESEMLRLRVFELAERLTVVRSQVTRAPRLTPRLDAAREASKEPVSRW